MAPTPRLVGLRRRSDNRSRTVLCGCPYAAPTRPAAMRTPSYRCPAPTTHACGQTSAQAAAQARSTQRALQTACFFETSASTACEPVESIALGASDLPCSGFAGLVNVRGLVVHRH